MLRLCMRKTAQHTDNPMYSAYQTSGSRGGNLSMTKDAKRIGCLAIDNFATWRHVRRSFGQREVGGPSFVPWVMVGALALLAAFLILRALRRQRAADVAPLIEMPDRPTLLRLGAFALLLAAYSAAFFPIGYLPATLATFVLGLLLIGERNPLLLIGFPVVMTGAVYFAFTELLSVWLP